jgi:hypothetical protein
MSGEIHPAPHTSWLKNEQSYRNGLIIDEDNVEDYVYNYSMTNSQESPSPDAYDEYFEGNGFMMARKGRHIIMQSNRTKEEQKALLQSLHDGREETEASIQSQIQVIEDLIHNYDPLDILANISLRNSIINPEEFKEYESKINPAYTEFIALLCLTQSFESFNFENPEPIPPNLIEEIQERVQKLFFSQILYLAFKNVNPERTDPPGVVEKLRFLTLTDSLIVRYPAYHHQLIEDLLGIFSSLSSEMVNTLGFSINDALLILDGVGDIISSKLSKKREESIKQARALRRVVKKFRHKKKIKQIISEYPKDLLESLIKNKPSVSAKNILDFSIAWMFYSLGRTLSFTIEELVAQTKLDPAIILSFFNKYSLQFGEVDSLYRNPAPTHPLMRKPFIKNQDQYFCPVIQSAFWSLRPAIEDFWNPQSQAKIVNDDTIWQKYLKSRANYLERSAIESLSHALRYSAPYHNLKYDVYTEEGAKVETELDGLLILDNALFLVEAKSGSLSWPARRGAPSGMKEDLAKLVEDAYSQALRASNYIANTDRPTFRLADGTQFTIDKSKYDEVFLITISLDDLDIFITNAYLLKELGFFHGGEYPWALTLANLRVISEITEFSSQFVHYIKRRLHLNDLGWVSAHDELDWFGNYLLEGLYFDGLKEKPEEKFNYNLLSYSWIFDDYYFFITGQRRTPVDKPSQIMPETMWQILSELDIKHDNGYLKVACCLMNMSSQSREELMNTCVELRGKTQSDREIHSITVSFLDGDFGFAYFFSPFELENEIPDRIMKYSILKKYQTKLSRWVTIACVSDKPGWVDYFVVVDGQWVFDQQLDDAAKKLLQPWSVNG